MPDRQHRRSTLLLIDVEPDARRPVRASAGGWDGTRAALPLIDDARRELERRTGAPVVLNWFLRLDPQIEEAWGRADQVHRAVPELLDAIAVHGDYAGIHPHLWRWSSQARDWYNDLQDEAWMRRCLDTAVESYAAIFGRSPEACRFGDRFLSDDALRALQRHGIRYDLSLEPGRPAERPPGDRRARGMLPDTRASSRVPFQRAGVDATNGADRPWVVPLTTSAPRWQPVWYPPFVVRASVGPNLALSPLLVGPHFDRELARDTRDPLVLALRTGDLGRPRRLAYFRRNLARILAHPGLARCELTTPPVAVGRWLESRAATSAVRADGAVVAPAPDVSISIVTFESADCLPDLIGALRAQTRIGIETFVVDNASRDAESARRLLDRESSIAVTWNTDNVGFGRAHNQNLSRFRGRYVLLLNPDVRFGPDLCEGLATFLDTHPDVAIAGPRIVEGASRREFPPRRFYPGEGMVPLEPGSDRGEIAWLNGCCLIVRRTVLEELGGFDPAYFLYAEEPDLCLRARRAGHRIGWCPTVEVHHRHQQSQPGSDAEERSRRLFRGVAVFWEKHYRPADVRKMVRFQSWACRLLLAAGPVLPALARRWPALDRQRLRGRLDVCREWMAARGMRPTGLGDLPVRIALRQVALLGRWLVHRRVPLDDY